MPVCCQLEVEEVDQPKLVKLRAHHDEVAGNRKVIEKYVVKCLVKDGGSEGPRKDKELKTYLLKMVVIPEARKIANPMIELLEKYQGAPKHDGQAPPNPMERDA